MPTRTRSFRTCGVTSESARTRQRARTLGPISQTLRQGEEAVVAALASVP